jgi:YegS/Rv2252/BmrU family lipid kinase
MQERAPGRGPAEAAGEKKTRPDPGYPAPDMNSPAPPGRTALVVLNARSGTGCGPERATELQQQFADAGMAADVVLARDAQEMFAAIDTAQARGVAAVVAGGGDGTQSAVASRLVDTDMVHGVLPLGTLNHFAKDLGIPLKIEDAVRTVAQGRVRQVDVGEVNGRVFINNSSLGLYPEIVRARELQQMHLGKSKWRALASAVLRVTERPHGLAVRIATEGEEALRRTPFVFVGNNPYIMEGFRIGARAGLEQGQLAVYLGRRRGRLALVRMALRALMGRLQQDVDFEQLAGEAFEISTRYRRIRVAADGEVFMMDTPLRYRIRPRALRVMVPQPAA